VSSLTYALTHGRVAPVILFTGIRGTGKTTLARLLVKAINCYHLSADGEPCNSCDSCIEIMAGRSPDVFEIDGASNNSVDDVRDIRDNVLYAPVKSKKKTYIIDEVHMLSKSAFNALLKTLEEPPEHTLFILATTDPQKIPATVLSRCQRYDLRRLSVQSIVSQLKKILDTEGIAYDENALFDIAREGEGSMRDAQTLVEQMLAFGERRVTSDVVSLLLGMSDRSLTLRLIESLVARDADTAVKTVREIYRSGKALERVSQSMLTTIHQVALVSALGNATMIEDAPEEEKRWLETTAQKQNTAEWLRLFDFWNKQHELIVRSDYVLMLFEASILMASAFPAMEDVRSFLETILKRNVGATAGEAPTAVSLSAPPSPSSLQQTGTAPQSSETRVTTWREFLNFYSREDPWLVAGLSNAPYDEHAEEVVVKTNKALDALLKEKRQTLIERFAALTGGKRLSFESEKKGIGRSVAEEDQIEEEKQTAQIQSELRQDPAVRQMEQLGFVLKKIGKNT